MQTRTATMFRWFATLILCLALGCGVCLAADFSADLNQSIGKMKMSGKVYVSGQKMRQDLSMGATKHIVIVRGDKGLVYMLQPSAKQYMKMQGVKGELGMNNPKAMDELKKSATQKRLGTENVSGYSCAKSLFTFKDKTKGSLTLWTASRLGGHPIKTQMKTSRGNVLMEYKNIKVGRQSASLF
ncbi:MAG: DUF4412 domain-containing protein, partial [Armatimonadetes bacterium]|nr:DUF4412 domain-containing protein [Armatimonadota bacterium]